MPDCPRCGHADVTGAACPRCGVIVAKYRPPRPRADVTTAHGAEPTSAERSPAGDEAGSRVLILGAAGVALFVAGLVVARISGGKPKASPAPSAAPTTAQDTAAAPFEAPPPSLAVAPPPTKVEDLLAELAQVPDADRAKAEELSRRLLNPRSVTESDVQAAEGLLARFPEEKRMRELVEVLLLTLADQERQRRQYAQAIAHLQRAAAAQPASVRPHLALLAVKLEAGDWAGAEAAARAVVALDPRKAEAWQSLGYALLRQDRSREAAEALRMALSIRDDAVTQAMLDRVNKSMADESGMTQQQLSHFHVRYDGDAHEAVGREILRALERHYATLTTTLDHQPATTIPVILFSRENYYNASGAPAWSGGVYDNLDGRIRIPIGGLTASLTPDMDGTLIHELTHAFVADRTGGQAPREIHEGLAQYMEGKRVASLLSPQYMAALADGRLGGVGGYYLGALSFVEHLMAVRGQGGMNELLKAMGETGSVDEAFRRVHGMNFRAAQQAWAQRLRQQYGS